MKNPWTLSGCSAPSATAAAPAAPAGRGDCCCCCAAICCSNCARTLCGACAPALWRRRKRQLLVAQRRLTICAVVMPRLRALHVSVCRGERAVHHHEQRQSRWIYIVSLAGHKRRRRPGGGRRAGCGCGGGAARTACSKPLSMMLSRSHAGSRGVSESDVCPCLSVPWPRNLSCRSQPRPSSWQPLQRLTHGRHLQLLRGGARSVEVVTRTSLRVPKPLTPLTIRDDSAHGGEKAAGEAARDDGTCLSANSIATLDALVDGVCWPRCSRPPRRRARSRRSASS